MDTQFKKLIPSIYLYDGKAVRGLGDLDTVNEDPSALAAKYDNGFTDALMIFDLSDTDSGQDMAAGFTSSGEGESGEPIIGEPSH